LHFLRGLENGIKVFLRDQLNAKPLDLLQRDWQSLFFDQNGKLLPIEKSNISSKLSDILEEAMFDFKTYRNNYAHPSASTGSSINLKEANELSDVMLGHLRNLLA
jgi:hypothetical protein